MARLPFLARKHDEIERRIHEALEAERASQKPPTGYIRLSSIGKCPRALWALRTGIPEERPPDGRTLMVFDVGKSVEGAVLSWLRRAGFYVRDRSDIGTQIVVRMAGGIGIGHLDGIARKRLSDPGMLVEVKTAKAKRFAELVEAGSYAAWNREYADQIQAYLGASHETDGMEPLDDSLAVVVNKDSSELWVEKIRYDEEAYAKLKERAAIAMGEALPARPAEGKSQYCGFCKYCPVNAWCWSALPEANFDD